MPACEAKLSNSGAIGGQLVGDKRRWRVALSLQKPPHQLERCTLIPLGLNEDIENFAFLIDRTPEIHVPSSDRYEHLIEMPLTVCLGSKRPQSLGVSWPETRHPAADRFVGDLNATFGQKIFGITQTQRESAVEPNGVLDDVRREVVILVTDQAHQSSLPTPRLNSTRILVTRPLDELAMHPTVKPVALVADAIKDCSKRGDIVLDAFGGSGTTIIAAEKTGRRGYALELDPRYVDVAIERWQRLTGEDAVHVESGFTFSELT